MFVSHNLILPEEKRNARGLFGLSYRVRFVLGLISTRVPGTIARMLSVKFQEKDLKVGDTLRVKYNIVEGNKTRVQTFEGILIRIQGRGENRMITVRRIGDRGIGVERMWPVDAPALVGIDVVRSAKKIRRSRLYFLRDLTGRMATRI